MNHNEDELQKELSKMKTSHSLDPQTKKSMKMTIQKHAKRKRKRAKLKRSAIWFSTAAALLIGAGLLFSTINSNQSVMPFEEHNQTEYNDTAEEGKEMPAEGEENEETTESAAENTDPPPFSVSEQGTETQTVMIEGMENETTITNYTLEPYGIQYQIEEFLGNYTMNNQTVRHYSDADNAWVTLEVMEDASLDDVVSNVQTEYGSDFNYTEEPADTSQDENPYEGIRQHFSDPPQGYYAYQIEENVLVIQYEYVIEAGDGMGPGLQVLRDSITQ